MSCWPRLAADRQGVTHTPNLLQDWTWFLAGDAVSGKLFAYSCSCIRTRIRKQEVLGIVLPISGWKSPKTASVGPGQCHMDICGSLVCPITCLGTRES